MKNYALIFLLLFGCEKPHPAEGKASLILDAIKFGDQETLLKNHIENSKHAIFCTAEFERTLKKVEKTKTPKRCAEIKSMSKKVFIGLSDEAKLTAKIARFSCRDSVKSCETFSTELLKESLDSMKWMKQVKGYKIKRTIGDEASAVVYVEFAGAFGVKRSALKFKKISSTWLLKSGLQN
jgi:hypothetical protein